MSRSTPLGRSFTAPLSSPVSADELMHGGRSRSQPGRGFATLVAEFVEYEARRRKLPVEGVLPTEADLERILRSEETLAKRLVPGPGKIRSWLDRWLA